MIIRRNILRKASIVLLAIIVILATGAVTAHTDEKNTKKITQPKVSCTPTRAPFGVELLTEGFEDGIMPPPGWDTINTHPIYNWDIVDNETYPEFVHSGDYAGWVNWDSEYASDEWLISPSIDLTNADEVTLIFWALSDTNWPGATVELHIIGEGFEHIIWNMTDENWLNFTYREMIFDISKYTDHVITIAWRYVGFDGQSFGLDDIRIIKAIPILTITNIKASSNEIIVEVENSGNGTAENIHWKMNILDKLTKRLFRGLLFSPKNGEGMIEFLAPHDKTTFSIKMMGLGITKVSFNILYTLNHASRGEVEMEVFQEENVLGLVVALDNTLIPQPERTWEEIDQFEYIGNEVHLTYEFDIHNMHQIRVHKPSIAKTEYQSSCSFSNGEGIVIENGMTKQWIDMGYSWEVELVNGA